MKEAGNFILISRVSFNLTDLIGSTNDCAKDENENNKITTRIIFFITKLLLCLLTGKIIIYFLLPTIGKTKKAKIPSRNVISN